VRPVQIEGSSTPWKVAVADSGFKCAAPIPGGDRRNNQPRHQLPSAGTYFCQLFTPWMLTISETYDTTYCNMVCTKCQKTIKQTELATPAVKRKNDMYYRSPTSDKNKATLGSGISKVGFNALLNRYSLVRLTEPLQNKLLSKPAKNPYALYSSSCETCKTKTEQGRKYCQRCAYKANGKWA
jgi:hypothetical protein